MSCDNNSRAWFIFIRIIESTPGINFLYDTWGDDQAPQMQEIKDALNICLTLGALLLAVVAGFVGAMTYDDMLKADVRWVESQYVFAMPDDKEKNEAGFYKWDENEFQYHNLYMRDTRLWPNWLFISRERTPPSLRYQQGMIFSFILIAGSLIVAFYTYVDGVGTNLAPFTKKVNGKPDPRNEIIRNAWWRFAKWNLIIIFVGIFTGMCSSR